MRKLSSYLAAIALAILMACLLPMAAYAENDLTASPAASLDAQSSDRPEWSGSLFSKKPYVYNNDLALKAAEISKAAYGSDSNAINDLFDEYGFIDYQSCGYEKSYNKADEETEGDDTSAFTVGHCKLKISGKSWTVLVVAVRGTWTLAEAVGDFTKWGSYDFLGKRAYSHVGEFYNDIYSAAHDYVLDHKDLRDAMGAGNVKVLITGHSLGGAAANMFAANTINDAREGTATAYWKKLEPSDVYAYTFGAIKVITDEGNAEFGYEGIHNVYNHYDSWGPNGHKSAYQVSSPKAKFGHTDLFDIGQRTEWPALTDTPNHDMEIYIEALEQKVVSCGVSKSYKVAFKANGGKGSMKTQKIYRGVKTALSANKFKKSGYTFNGWNTKANGKGKSYKNKAEVKNLAKAGKTVKLYAQWKKAKKAITVKNKAFTLTLPAYWTGKVKVQSNALPSSDYRGKAWELRVTDKKTGILLFRLYYGAANDNGSGSPSTYARYYAETGSIGAADNPFIGCRIGSKYALIATCNGLSWTIDAKWDGWAEGDVMGLRTISQANHVADLLTGGEIKNKKQRDEKGGKVGERIEKYLNANVLRKMKVN